MSRSKTPKTLALLMSDQPMGVVERLGDKLSFTYDDTYRNRVDATALSFSMPLAKARHDDPVVSSFLWGLVSDNERTIADKARRAQVSPNSIMQLLAAYGEDLPGALQAGLPETIESFAIRQGVTSVSGAKLAAFIDELLRSPGATQITEHGGRFSLAGAQPKKALNWTNGRFYEPQGRTPSTHILKPAIPDLQGQVENEHFCLRLASAVGLKAARSAVVTIGSTPVIVVERYDRVRFRGLDRVKLTDSGGVVHRIHQEDFCQALGIHPTLKYENQGGPGMSAVMDVLAASARAGEDRDLFMRACALSFVVGGTDAHAKNYSLLHAPGGSFRLAPLYDVISILPYEDRHRDRKLGMSVGGEYRYDKIEPKHWAREAEACGYDADAAVGCARDLLVRLPDAASDVLARCKEDGLASEQLDRLVRLLAQRCRLLRGVYGAEAVEARAPAS
jgi:serine/threonine-protein kinase HipA